MTAGEIELKNILEDDVQLWIGTSLGPLTFARLLDNIHFATETKVDVDAS